MQPARYITDPFAPMRKAIEALAPATHRPATTGLHEVTVKIFVGKPSTLGSRSTKRSSTRP